MKQSKIYYSPNINILEVVPESFFLAGSGNDYIKIPIIDEPFDGDAL